ncbi:MAG TPA: permease-like cell division protein FtsX [Gaiellales bacterium]|nr:permease-like cell division protein FtsX [Gaiellales bacterium]
MRWRFFFSEALRSIKGNAATTVAATVTVLIVTFLMGIFVTTGWWVYHYAVEKRNEVTVKLYLPSDYSKSADKRGQMANLVRQLPYVKSFRYVSPEEAKSMLSPSARKAIDELGFNPLPPAFYVKLTDPEKASVTAAAALKIPDIKNCGSPGKCVSYGKKITDQVLTTLKYILLFVGGLALLLGVAAVVLIQNTIRLSIFARRREIEVMKLVGATNSFVRLPFMLEGMLTGLLGAIGAVGLLAIVYVALDSYNNGLTDPARLVGIPLLIALLACFGLILGAAGSGLTLRRFLRV